MTKNTKNRNTNDKKSPNLPTKAQTHKMRERGLGKSLECCHKLQLEPEKSSLLCLSWDHYLTH